MEEAAGVLSKEERLVLLRLLKNWEKAGKINRTSRVPINCAVHALKPRRSELAFR